VGSTDDSAPRSCTRDEGRPLGTGLQEQVPNHLKLHGSRARVVSVEGKGMAKTVSDEVQGDEEDEPLKVSKAYGRCQNWGAVVTPGQAQGEPVYCLGGIRHKGGVNLYQALVRNVGTCRPDAKGEAQVVAP